MQVMNRLAALIARVAEDPKSRLDDIELPGDLGAQKQQLGRDVRIGKFSHRRHVNPRDHQNVHGRKRIYVAKRETAFVFGDEFGPEITPRYLAKDAVFIERRGHRDPPYSRGTIGTFVSFAPVTMTRVCQNSPKSKLFAARCFHSSAAPSVACRLERLLECLG